MKRQQGGHTMSICNVQISSHEIKIERDGLNVTRTISPEQSRQLINYIFTTGTERTDIPTEAKGERPPGHAQPK
jgi:hypothetical protein